MILQVPLLPGERREDFRDEVLFELVLEEKDEKTSRKKRQLALSLDIRQCAYRKLTWIE